MNRVGSLLVIYHEAAGNLLEKVAIALKHVRQEVCAGRPIGVGKVVGYYYGSVVYSDLGGQKLQQTK